jgi:hypothetical protein
MRSHLFRTRFSDSKESDSEKHADDGVWRVKVVYR